MRKNVTVYNTL